MPCDTVQTNTVELPKMAPALRDRALAAIGAKVTNPYSFYYQGTYYRMTADGITTTAGEAQAAATAAKLKQAYSAEVVKYAAQRNGWTITQTAPFQFKVQR